MRSIAEKNMYNTQKLRRIENRTERSLSDEELQSNPRKKLHPNRKSDY